LGVGDADVKPVLSHEAAGVAGQQQASRHDAAGRDVDRAYGADP